MKINKQLLDDLYWDDEDIYRYLPRIKGIPQRNNAGLRDDPTRRPSKVETEVYEQFDYLRNYDFTYEASRHEEWWLLDSLGPFFDEQWFNDVIKLVKGGKEASVYLCKANPSTETALLAAKVYRPRSLRNLRKDHIYREGRPRLDAYGVAIHDGRKYRAMRNRTDYGKELMHTSWIEHEFRTLKILYEAGCDVPVPYASDHNAILMDFIGDEDITAPTLNGIDLRRKEAQTLFDRVVHNINLMLSHQRVHGDLSAYNVLYWNGEIKLIDFPQAVNPNRNPNAYIIFQRDVTRICDYFISQGVSVNPFKLSEDLWIYHGFSTEPNILCEEPDEYNEFEEDEIVN